MLLTKGYVRRASRGRPADPILTFALRVLWNIRLDANGEAVWLRELIDTNHTSIQDLEKKNFLRMNE